MGLFKLVDKAYNKPHCLGVLPANLHFAVLYERARSLTHLPAKADHRG